jgi:arsenite methyltransferase
MSMTNAAADYFKRVAGQWDDIRSSYFTAALREAAIAKAYLPTGAIVADVGAGTGFMAAGLAPLAAQVYVLDGSAEMLAQAQRNLAGHDNVIYRQADGVALLLDDASVDAVFANMYLHHTADPAAAIREMVRILRPGGRLVITDMEQHNHEWMRAEMADEWLGFAPDQMRAWLREAGLVNVIVDASGQSCCGESTSAAGTCNATSQTGEAARINVFVAAGSRRVPGAQAAVQTNYGALAANGISDAAAQSASACCSSGSGGSSCCAPGMADISGGDMVLYDSAYSAEQLAAVPVEAAQLSLGCGNPTAMASLRPGEVVLDIGSGAGIDAFYAARRVGIGGKVIGLDMTPAMIARATASAASAGLPQVEFRLGQAEEMPVASDTVDVILSNCVINLCEDKGRVFEEAYRVLKPGGRLSISDMVTDRPLTAAQRGDARLWADCVHGALPEAEYLDLLRQAGFTGVAGHRTLSGGELSGVQIYSLSVTATKPAACGCK